MQKSNKIKCDQCNASIVSTTIDGQNCKNVFCHEAGCPNAKKT